MKKTILIFTVLIALAFSSCKKDATTNTQNSEAGYITCKVNGAPWRSLKATDTFSYYGDVYNGVEAYLDSNNFVIYGLKPYTNDSVSGVVINLELTTAKVGSYTGIADDDGGAAFGFDLDDDVVSMYDITYTVNITKFDMNTKKVSGNFNMTQIPKGGGTTLNISEGSFNDIAIWED